MIASTEAFEPLWHDRLDCVHLEAILESISLKNIPSLSGLAVKSSTGRILPYYVEGYDVFDSQGVMVGVEPKGLEVRTPVTDDSKEAVRLLRLLRQRLADALSPIGLALIALSHHPVETVFTGSQQHRSPSRWIWAKEAMFNYAAHVNISLPDDLQSYIDIDDLHAKVDYYGPALAAISVAAPFYDGHLWKIGDRIGKSKRIHRRSRVAPAFVYYPNQNHRLEFKSFDMSSRDDDFHAYILLWLALVLEDRLAGRGTQRTRLRDMNTASIYGLESDKLYRRANEIACAATRILPKWGFDDEPLSSLFSRMQLRRSPADEMIEWALDGEPITEIMQRLAIQSRIQRLRPFESPCFASNVGLQ